MHTQSTACQPTGECIQDQMLMTASCRSHHACSTLTCTMSLSSHLGRTLRTACLHQLKSSDSAMTLECCLVSRLSQPLVKVSYHSGRSIQPTKQFGSFKLKDLVALSCIAPSDPFTLNPVLTFNLSPSLTGRLKLTYCLTELLAPIGHGCTCSGIHFCTRDPLS